VLDALLREIETNDAGLQNLLEDLAAKQGLIPGETEVASPDDFKSFGEDIETEHRCPKCGYEWSGKAN
jgi:rubrerythrin